MELFKWFKKQDPSEKPPIPHSRDIEKCTHENWSSRYDYKTYPGAVKIVESYCLSCGIYETGSGQ